MKVKKQLGVFMKFCRKPFISKAAITLSSLAVGASVFSLGPLWHDERPMPDSLKKKLH